MNKAGNMKSTAVAWDDQALRSAALQGMKAAMVIVDHQGKVLQLDDQALPLASIDGQMPQNGLMFNDLGVEIQGKPARFEILKEFVAQTGSKIRLERGVKISSASKSDHGWLMMSPLMDPENACLGFLVVLGASEAFGVNLLEWPNAYLDHSQHLFVRKEGEYVRINLSTIQAVEAMENYVQIITDQDRIVVHTTMKSMQAQLQPKGFIRVHRSYLVPLAGILSFDESRLKVGSLSIPVGKSYRPELLKSLNIL